MTDIEPLLRHRWSPTLFDPQHTVPEEDLRLLLEAARWAPSARNVQPWRFIPGRRGDATRARIEPFVRGFSDWALDASLLVVNVYEAWTSSPDYALYDLGGAVAHLTFQAEALGLHLRQFATFDRPGLSGEFGIAPPFTAVTICAIGVTPGGVQPGERGRRGIDELLWQP